MQSVTIPGNQTSTIRLSLDTPFTEQLFDGSDADALGIDLIGGRTYRITLDPADNTSTANKNPLIGDILDSSGNSLGLSDNDSGSGTASVLLFTPSTDDTYFIVVTGFGANDVAGWYTAEVSEFSAPADDFSNALDPSNPLTVWKTQDGRIDSNGDTDTIALSLKAGFAVDITLYGNDGGFYGELSDTNIISFVDSTGTAIDPATYDTAQAVGKFTSGGNLDAHQITYTPASTGIYYITVGAGSGATTGDYSLSISGKDRGIYSIRANEEFVATGNAEVDAFFIGALDTNADHIYSDRNADGTTTLTYSLPGVNAQFSPAEHNVVLSEWTNGYEPASGVVLDTFLAVMEHIETFSNIDFVEVTDNNVRSGTFRIGNTDVELGSASGALVTGWSGFPEWLMAGETWINTDKGIENVALIQSFGVPNLTVDNFLTNRTIHEFTHNLGLNHADQSSLANMIDASKLGQEYSVMSRTNTGLFNVPTASDMMPQTLMWFDIQAIQAAYGVDTVTTAGSDVYSLSNSSRNFKTIWDYGGTDQLKVTGPNDIIIDLTPGTWQDVGTDIRISDGSRVIGINELTVFIAPDTTIENLVAGAGDDSLLGNNAANEIIAAGGDDTVDGGNGYDTLNGGGGEDRLFGGAGRDVLRGEGADDRLEGGDGNDTLDGGSKDDVLRGDAGNDLIIGGDGDDTVTGQDGADELRGNAGNDQIRAGDGKDTATGGDGNDLVFGQGGNDYTAGQDGNDVVKGNGGDDTMLGGPGDDRMLGGFDDDLINGGGDNDDLFGQRGMDTLLGGAGDDLLKGNGENDSLSGGGDEDRLFGGDGNDTLSGGAGNDFLHGNLNDDILNGNAGNDTLRGGGHNDTFVFEAGLTDDDTIMDLATGAASDDVVSLVGFGAGLDEFSEVVAAATDSGSDVVIDLGGGESLTLLNTQISDLHQDDFIFS